MVTTPVEREKEKKSQNGALDIEMRHHLLRGRSREVSPPRSSFCSQVLGQVFAMSELPAVQHHQPEGRAQSYVNVRDS